MSFMAQTYSFDGKDFQKKNEYSTFIIDNLRYITLIKKLTVSLAIRTYTRNSVSGDSLL